MPQFAKMLILLFSIASFSFAGPVSYYGKLQVNENKLVGSKTGNTPVQVRGVSLGWSNTSYESSAFFNATTVKAMVDGWKAEIIRVPYGEDNSANETRIKTAIDAAIDEDVYVIIDWHSHNAESQGTAPGIFFGKMARAYGNNDHVIFEIYNEPLAVSWATIKNYAIPVIDTIRKYSSNLILVGTPNWAQNVNAVVNNAISGKGNIAYVLHFYAYSHPLSSFTASGGGNASMTFQDAVNMALNAKLPIFVSEYGTTHSDGGQNDKGNYNTHSGPNTDAWHTFMDNNKISSCAWNVNDKYEGSAFFGTNSSTAYPNVNRFPQTSANFIDESKMTESGKYIFRKLKSYANSAPWRGGGDGGEELVTDPTGYGYPIFPYRGKNAANEVTAYNDYVFGYSYNPDKNFTNPTLVPEDGTTWFDQGVAKLKDAVMGAAPSSSNDYNTTGAALGLKNSAAGASKNLGDCNAISYYYKGAAHEFQMEFSVNLCSGATGDGDGSNKWGVENVTASTTWKKQEFKKIDLSLYNTWSGSPGSKCKTPGPAVDFSEVTQMAWEVNNKTAPNGMQSLMIADVICLTTSGSQVNHTIPPEEITISTGWVLPPPPSSSSSVASPGGSSSSKGSSSSGANLGGSSSSNGVDSDDSSSSDEDTPILTLPKIAHSNSAIASKNGINLAVKSNAVVQVFGLKGNSMRKFNFANGVYSVSFSDLPKGLYIVKVSFGNEKRILRVPVN